MLLVCYTFDSFVLRLLLHIYITVCAWGYHLFLHKRVEQCVHFGISAQSDHSHTIDQTHVQTFMPKLIMTSPEYHLVTSQ